MFDNGQTGAYCSPMTNYLGRAANSPEEVAKAKEDWRLYMRQLRLEAGGVYSEEDDGRGDEAHPDSCWVDGWNRGQRGET